MLFETGNQFLKVTDVLTIVRHIVFFFQFIRELKLFLFISHMPNNRQSIAEKKWLPVANSIPYKSSFWKKKLKVRIIMETKHEIFRECVFTLRLRHDIYSSILVTLR